MAKKKIEKNPSEIIQEFLDLMAKCQKEYQESVSKVWQYDKRKPIDYMHDLEFINSCKERSRLSTKIHNERIERRKYKDIVKRTEKIATFYADKQNKQFFERIRSLILDQREIEEFLDGERHYNRRASDESNANS